MRLTERRLVNERYDSLSHRKVAMTVGRNRRVSCVLISIQFAVSWTRAERECPSDLVKNAQFGGM
jgi:hypothetical protein